MKGISGVLLVSCMSAFRGMDRANVMEVSSDDARHSKSSLERRAVPTDGHQTDSHTLNAQSKDGQHKDGQSKDGQSKDGHGKEQAPTPTQVPGAVVSSEKSFQTPTDVAALTRIMQGSDKIPWRLFFCSKFASISDLPLRARMNMQKTLDLNPGIPVSWMDDTACRNYMIEMGESELVTLFDRALSGKYRSDLCRTLALYHRGGYYVDGDLELKIPFVQLVDSNTTFLSSWAVDGDLLNAFIGVEKKSPIMKATLEVMKQVDDSHALSKHPGLVARSTMEGGEQSSAPNSKPDSKSENKEVDSRKEVGGPASSLAQTAAEAEADARYALWGPKTLRIGFERFLMDCGFGEEQLPRYFYGNSSLTACGEDIRIFEEVNLRHPRQWLTDKVYRSDYEKDLKAAGRASDLSIYENASRPVLYLENAIAQYHEEHRDVSEEAAKKFNGLDFAIIKPGQDQKPATLIAFTRFEGCGGYGCDQGEQNDVPASSDEVFKPSSKLPYSPKAKATLSKVAGYLKQLRHQIEYRHRATSL